MTRLRSIFFLYKGAGVVSDVKSKVPYSLSGWKDVAGTGDLKEVLCPKKKVGTDPIKLYSQAFVRALGRNARLVPIPEERFAKFLVKEGAQDKSWTMRFWEVREREEWSRAITAGKETPDVWKNITDAMTAAKRITVWAGVEFTHPELQTRVMMHRWPTAAIAPWGEGGAPYEETKKRFRDLLERNT